jgi:hypothetical protein
VADDLAGGSTSEADLDEGLAQVGTAPFRRLIVSEATQQHLLRDPERLWCGPSLRDLLAAPHTQHASPHEEHDLHACCPLLDGTLGRRPGVTNSTGVTGGVSTIVSSSLCLLEGRCRQVEPRQTAADTAAARPVPEGAETTLSTTASGLAVRRVARRVSTRRFGFCTGVPGCDREEDHVHRLRVTRARCHEGLTSRDTPTRTGDIPFCASTRRQQAPVTTVFICARRILG